NGHPSPLIVWNRSAAKAQQLSGVMVAETFEEVAQQKKKTIICEMSTIAPKLTFDLHTQATELGDGLLATTIFGLPSKAHAAKLIIIKAGDIKLRDIVSPYLIPAMGNKTNKTLLLGVCLNTSLVAYVNKMAAGEYTKISFRVAGVKKDLKHIIELGAE
ncbi:hypothetical protein K450DRAFT_255584, partial [Umbelopsis ramanniana AG]